MQQPGEDRIEELDLLNLSQSDPADQREDKAETLRLVRQRGVSTRPVQPRHSLHCCGGAWSLLRVPPCLPAECLTLCLLQVRRMTNVHCRIDPDWALDVLRSAAPTLEELEMWHASEAHVAAVHGMPRLQRLELNALRGQRPVELPALPWPSCLKWLRVQYLPRATTVSLLRAHATSLDVLWLQVYSEPRGKWPYGCADLDALLGQCGLRLTRLVLWRFLEPHGSSCRAQREAARRVLPGCTVQCDNCNRVPPTYI